MISGLFQPAGVTAHEPPDDPEGRATDQPDAGEIKTCVAAVTLLDPAEHKRHCGQADRDVEPEDPRPVDALGDRAADQRALATAIPVTALNRPIAAPLRSGGKAALRSARPSVSTSAAPAPWTARAAISQPMPGASAEAADAAAKRPSPPA